MNDKKLNDCLKLLNEALSLTERLNSHIQDLKNSLSEMEEARPLLKAA